MNTRIVLTSIGLLGIALTVVQAHTLGFYLDTLYALAGSQTQAEELVIPTGALLTPYGTDSAVEQTSIYRKKQFASATERAAKEVLVWATAYTSHPLETDDTPFVTASGSVVRDGIAAANFLPMGTKFKLPDLYGDKVFIIEDRMNSRYNDTKIIDLWFESRAEAFDFGRKSVVLQLL